MDDEVSITEAAALKGVTRATIHRAISEGRLPARADIPAGKVRGTWMIRRADLEQWQPLKDRAERASHSAQTRWSKREGKPEDGE